MKVSGYNHPEWVGMLRFRHSEVCSCKMPKVWQF